MICACFDYVLYRFRKGKYSTISIEKQGAVLAVTDNFKNVTKAQPGDGFWLHTRDCFLSWLVMYYTNSAWSHCGIFADGGKIIDATVRGVQKHQIHDYCDGKSYILVKGLRATEEQRKRILEWAEKTIGAGYNWRGVLLFWLRIITGLQEGHQWYFFADIAIFFAIVALLEFWIPGIARLVIGSFLIYAGILSFNIVRRRTRKAVVQAIPSS